MTRELENVQNAILGQEITNYVKTIFSLIYNVMQCPSMFPNPLLCVRYWSRPEYNRVKASKKV